MNKLTFDLESRSKIDLRKQGVYVYAQDESTDILCFAFKVNSEAPRVWVPEKFSALYAGPKATDREFKDAIASADIIEAHNAGFEMALYFWVMQKRYLFDPIPLEKMRCSAAKAASFALPRSLDGAINALGLSTVKDKEGYKIMLRMCKPQRKKKKDKSLWHEKPEDFEKLVAYCIQDVEAEHALSQSLLELSANEQKLWFADQRINQRGVYVDLKGIENLIGKVEAKEFELLTEIDAITGGAVKSVRQRDKTLKWLESQGTCLEGLKKADIEKALKGHPPQNVKRLLQIRQQLSKSSVSKLQSMKLRASEGSRVCGSTIYHGASTGRWAGAGIQPQNYPRNSFSPEDVESILDLDSDMIEMLYAPVMTCASKCLRSMIAAAAGKTLYCADFSSIEARVLAWLAGEERALEAFRHGLDVYKVNAADIYKTEYAKVDKDQRQVGKCCELALGYQGWLGAFQSMTEIYGVHVPEEEAKRIILAWREARPNTVNFWTGLEKAAILAVMTKKPKAYGKLKMGVRGRFLHMRLPSGRLLAYCDPLIMKGVNPWGTEKDILTFMGVNSVTKKWERQKTYGGKLVENATQAAARDLLAEAILRIDPVYPVVLHVHDEIISEVEKGKNELENFIRLMSVVPGWARGCPVEADGWEGSRYRK
jgi:DNA polymerase